MTAPSARVWASGIQLLLRAQGLPSCAGKPWTGARRVVGGRSRPVVSAVATGRSGLPFLSFAPPHKTPTDLQCPVVCVIAWEYDSIPDDPHEDARHDWSQILARHGRAITLSSHTAQAIRRTMGEDFRSWYCRHRCGKALPGCASSTLLRRSTQARRCRSRAALSIAARSGCPPMG